MNMSFTIGAEKKIEASCNQKNEEKAFFSSTFVPFATEMQAYIRHNRTKHEKLVM